MQSGVGNSTAWPPGITQCLNGKKKNEMIDTTELKYRRGLVNRRGGDEEKI